jgi:tRNA threonylcarbamoyl adenosine modification protein YeaZ
VLAIETSNPSAHEGGPGSGCGAGVAGAILVAGGGISDPVEIPLDPGVRHDDGLMPAIEVLRTRLGVRAADLRTVCVSLGPGGYTGLRVAVTAAKMLCEATGAVLVGVPSAWVVAETAGIAPPFLVCLASKRETTHATLFRNPGPPWIGEDLGPMTAGDLDSVRAAMGGAGFLIADRFLPEPIRCRANDLGISPRRPGFSAVACLRVGLRLDPMAVASATPIYAREPEAVRLWRARPVG